MDNKNCILPGISEEDEIFGNQRPFAPSARDPDLSDDTQGNWIAPSSPSFRLPSAPPIFGNQLAFAPSARDPDLSNDTQGNWIAPSCPSFRLPSAPPYPYLPSTTEPDPNIDQGDPPPPPYSEGIDNRIPYDRESQLCGTESSIIISSTESRHTYHEFRRRNVVQPLSIDEDIAVGSSQLVHRPFASPWSNHDPPRNRTHARTRTRIRKWLYGFIIIGTMIGMLLLSTRIISTYPITRYLSLTGPDLARNGSQTMAPPIRQEVVGRIISPRINDSCPLKRFLDAQNHQSSKNVLRIHCATTAAAEIIRSKPTLEPAIEHSTASKIVGNVKVTVVETSDDETMARSSREDVMPLKAYAKIEIRIETSIPRDQVQIESSQEPVSTLSSKFSDLSIDNNIPRTDAPSCPTSQNVKEVSKL